MVNIKFLAGQGRALAMGAPITIALNKGRASHSFFPYLVVFFLIGLLAGPTLSGYRLTGFVLDAILAI